MTNQTTNQAGRRRQWARSLPVRWRTPSMSARGMIRFRARSRSRVGQLAQAAASLGTFSRRMFHRGQLFPQLFRGQLEELPKAQVGKLQAEEPVWRLILAGAGPEPSQVPVKPLQGQ